MGKERQNIEKIAGDFLMRDIIFNDGWDDTRGKGNNWSNTTVREGLIAFARLHVQEALQQVVDKVILIDNYRQNNIPVSDIFNSSNDYYIDRESILNAYPLENIK